MRLFFLVKLVCDIELKTSARTLHAVLKPIAVALDKMQSNQCSLADSVSIWKELRQQLASIDSTTQDVLNCFDEREAQALTGAHYAAFLLSPKLPTIELTPEEKSTGIDYIEENFPVAFMTFFLRFKAKAQPFRAAYFSEIEISDLEWWKSIRALHPEDIPDNYMDSISQLLTSIASSSGIERIFSKFGMVHADLRNRLGVKKAAKLIFVSCQMNKKH